MEQQRAVHARVPGLKIMGGDQSCQAFGLRVMAIKASNTPPQCRGIEIAPGGLIRQKDFGLVCQSAGDGRRAAARRPESQLRRPVGPAACPTPTQR